MCYYEETDFSDEKSSYYQRTLVKFTLLFRETYVVIWQMGRLSCWIGFFTEIQYAALFGLAVFYSLVSSLTVELKMDTRLLKEWKNDQENKYNIRWYFNEVRLVQFLWGFVIELMGGYTM